MEKNPLKRAWIWFWYNDVTRFLLVLVPSYFILLIPALNYAGVEPPVQKNILSFVYFLGIFWAMMDNNYSNLKRIGLDVHRRPLKPARQES